MSELTKLRRQVRENKKKIAHLSEELKEYKRYLTINPKTGLPNYKIFVKNLEKLIVERNAKNKTPFALFFIDLYESMTKIEYSLDSCLSNAIIAKTCMEIKEILEDIFNDSIHQDDKHVIISRGPSEGIKYDIYHSERNEELMIILRNIEDKKQCEEIAGIIYDKIAEPKSLDFINDIIHLTCYIAATLYPGDGIIKEELLTNTDIALKHAKAHHNTIHFYTSELGDQIREKRGLEADLRTIFRKKEKEEDDNSIELYFQPLVDSGYRIIGAEALVRWNHPDKGMIMPGVFINLAERSGLIVPLGYYVLKRACEYIKSWQDKSLLEEDFFLSVNFSPKQFRQQDLCEKIDEMLVLSLVSSQNLKIEITEDAYFENTDITSAAIEELSEKGLRIMIDDCGAPGNSIYNLKKLPEKIIDNGLISALKMDKSLIDSIHKYKDKLFFKNNLEMAWRLNFDVVIEGIETIEQEQILHDIEEELKENHIEMTITRQGYLFSRPVPEDKFINLLKNQFLIPAQ